MQIKKILSIAILISLVFCCSRSLCRGQKKKPPADYDYYALATSSISEIARDASKLPDIPQRVRILIDAAKILAPAEAQQLTGSISSQESRAWALLAVASVAAKEDRVLGFESITKALKALDASSPTPYKAELAMLATAMLVQNDFRRAFETLLTAVKYANSSEPRDSAQTKPPVGFGLEAKIGQSQTRLGVVPSSLGEIRIEPSLSGLAVTDWFRADQIVGNVRDPSLRLLLRLQFAGAVLAKELKSKKS